MNSNTDTDKIVLKKIIFEKMFLYCMFIVYERSRIVYGLRIIRTKLAWKTDVCERLPWVGCHISRALTYATLCVEPDRSPCADATASAPSPLTITISHNYSLRAQPDISNNEET